MSVKQKAAYFEAFAQRPPVGQLEALVPQQGSEALRDLLTTTSPTQLAPADIRDIVAGNLGDLTDDAYLYFLPSFMTAALYAYDRVSVFASELLTSLTRGDLWDWNEQECIDPLFDARFSSVSDVEGEAVFNFLHEFRTLHGEDFPFNELDIAIERYWQKFAKT